MVVQVIDLVMNMSGGMPSAKQQAAVCSVLCNVKGWHLSELKTRLDSLRVSSTYDFLDIVNSLSPALQSAVISHIDAEAAKVVQALEGIGCPLPTKVFCDMCVVTKCGAWPKINLLRVCFGVFGSPFAPHVLSVTTRCSRSCSTIRSRCVCCACSVVPCMILNVLLVLAMMLLVLAMMLLLCVCV